MSHLEKQEDAVRLRWLIRYGVAFLVAAIANLVGMSAMGSFGMFAIVIIPLATILVSGISILLCALFGNVLRVPLLKRYWFSSFAPVICISTLGLWFYLGGINNRHSDFNAKSAGTVLDPDEQFYQPGSTYWPGYFLIVFAAMNFPCERLRRVTRERNPSYI